MSDGNDNVQPASDHQPASRSPHSSGEACHMALAAPRAKKASVGFGRICGHCTHTTSGLPACQ